MPAAKIQMREEEDRIDKKVKSIKSDHKSVIYIKGHTHLFPFVHYE